MYNDTRGEEKFSSIIPFFNANRNDGHAQSQYWVIQIKSMIMFVPMFMVQ